MPIDARAVRRRNPLLKRDIQEAQSVTKSHRQAATYLNVAMTTYKKYAKLYDLYDTEFKNQSGIGIPRVVRKGAKGLDDVFAGKRPNYNRKVLKERMIAAGLLDHSCRFCGYSKTRPDGRGPFALTYNDDNHLNLAQDNLSLTCYNCYYLTHGRLRDSIDPTVDARDRIDPSEREGDNTLTQEEIEQLQESHMFANDDD
jgi:hypothetical protein